MKKCQQKERNGYTFTEMVIVLLCWSILLSCFIPLQYRTFQELEANLILQQLKEDLLLTQHLSMNEHVYYTLNFDEEAGGYVLYDTKERKTIFTRKLPEKWVMLLTTLQPTVRFNQKGIIQRAGTMYLYAPNKTYKIVFPFGSSRLRIEEI
ncbi:competence type IV pilus minor pilin ComGD [Halobacillus litoralis]|uniref:competence type IV pilus minor pilin ComGD n=1 Tax=Halobacillus litoralis TaxID=45668 RepID=UPI001CFEFC24|nr:competence type IV pilus minor pilin ComGD [Halobacillus litoralis]WLR46281.1 competence type IV pilus minor pilin ComGD [Halobacillus litoralis]